ncbi:unnamed protein product [Dovyalis caffra]|uniref:AT1G17665-like protein n=1 Tax=Dovyalis caffra TaxID=77055 RepID=A0AAV1SVS7_9ROSI|nr:unnamed protein product [Dovyalis caffra]
MFFLFFFTFLFSFSLSIFFFCKRLRRQHKAHDDPLLIDPSLSKLISGARKTGEDGPTHFSHSLLLDILPGVLSGGDQDKIGSGHGEERDGSVEDLKRVKKKKKRAKKKRLLDLKSEENGCGGDLEKEREHSGPGPGRIKPELVCLYPFTSTSSATQRKIKQQYDQLVKCNESNGLTLAQAMVLASCLMHLGCEALNMKIKDMDVKRRGLKRATKVGEFANCLIEARTELQHKSEVIKRKFTITKALLFKADRSSIDRLRQQIYKLELEQKRLEEDAFVYNWLQQQLKLSPAYKKVRIVEKGKENDRDACMELKAKSGEVIEKKETEFADISFEELLAQEKKDAFWQKNGKLRTYST